MRYFVRVLLLTASLLSSACSLDASLLDLNSPIKVVMDATLVNGAVLSQQKGRTVENGYRVQASAGNLTDGNVGTTVGGYRVFLSTQTVLLSQ